MPFDIETRLKAIEAQLGIDPRTQEEKDASVAADAAEAAAPDESGDATPEPESKPAKATKK